MNKYTLNVHCMQFINKMSIFCHVYQCVDIPIYRRYCITIYRYRRYCITIYRYIVDTLYGVSMTALIMAKNCLLFIDTSLKPHIYSCKMLLTLQRLTYIYVKQQQNLISRHYYLCRATSLKKFISWLNNMFVLLCFQRATCFS